jgi:hypothetical protein
VTIQRIQAGEGTTGEDLVDLADCDAGEPERCEWANLVGYEKATAVTIQEAEGDPKTVQEAQVCDDWPSWKKAMDCELSSLDHGPMSNQKEHCWVQMGFQTQKEGGWEHR